MMSISSNGASPPSTDAAVSCSDANAVLDRQFLYIIGAPRSGTSWLQIMLGAHPDVATTVELTLFNRYLHPLLQAWQVEADAIAQGRWNQGLPYLWSREQFHGFLRDFLAKAYEHVLAQRPAATHILDKHPGYSLHVDEIHLLLPRAKFIHIVRDGRDVAVSMLAARKKIGFGAETLPQAAYHWKENLLGARRAAAFEGQYLEIRYEELLTAGLETLQRVFDFCGLPASREATEEILKNHNFESMKANRLSGDARTKAPVGHYRTGKAGTWQAELTPLDRLEFEGVAGDLLQELGYDKAGWWADSLLQRGTLLARLRMRSLLARCRRMSRA